MFDIVILTGIVLFLLSAVVHNISCPDTGLYNAQAIKWIRNYPVIEGLGNLHGRFAYNSMFFVMSSPFIFEIKDALIFPLTGISFIVLIFKLYFLAKDEKRNGTIWMALFYVLLILLGILILLSQLNSPSPDIILSVLIIYSFILVITAQNKLVNHNISQYILVNLLIFTCVAFKLSSVFLVLVLPLFWKGDVIKRILISLITGIIVISPFLIRNYYLSGYLIYPYPAIDIFNVDWKIPLEKAIAEKAWIVSWARVPYKTYTEVLSMDFKDWIVQWFNLMANMSRPIVVFDILTIFGLIVMIIKKDLFLAKIQLIIILNLVFWFFSAPDPRFAYGFLFLGFSLTAAYIIKLLFKSGSLALHKYGKVVFLSILIIIGIHHRSYPIHTLLNPGLWTISAPFEKASVKEFNTNFPYRMPVTDANCYYSDLPCVPYSLDDVVMRGNDIMDGFKKLTLKESGK